MTDENFFETVYSVKSTSETRKRYDRWAEVYDQDLTGKGYRQPARCAAALRDRLSDQNARIIDIGCGTGLSGIALKEAGFKNLDGCDLSQAMLDKAQALKIYDRLFACDLNRPPIDVEDETYDGLTAVGVFSYGHVLADAVDEFLRMVKPGACLIIGLNDHYYEEGSLTGKLGNLVGNGKINMLSSEHGEHIPANDLKGWVITFCKI